MLYLHFEFTAKVEWNTDYLSFSISDFLFYWQLMAEEMGLKVDKEGFNRTMEEAREKARGARGKVWSFLHLVWVLEMRLLSNFFSRPLLLR